MWFGRTGGTFSASQHRIPYALVADNYAARGQHLPHPAQAERDAERQQNRVADDVSWEAIAGVAGANGRRHPVPLPALPPIRKPAGSQVDMALLRGRCPPAAT